MQRAIAAYDQAIALGAALDLDRPEFRNDLARSWTNKGNALQALGGPARLRDAIAAYDQAIALGAALDLDRPEFRNDLASSWTNKGSALAALGDPASLRDAIAAYDQAIALREALDFDRPEFRNGLASSWGNKGFALAALGDPASLRDAIAAYDQAIALRALLDLDRPEFRNDLASSWVSKGLALAALGDPASLRDAIAAYDQAIALGALLDLDRPEFRNDLASSWGSKGSALAALGDPASLRDAIAAYDQAIALREALDFDRPEFRNDLASSWTNKGLALAALGDPASLRDAIAAYDQAIALRALLDLDRPEFRNDLASSWTNKGSALAALGDPASLRDAIAAYDQAIALRALLDLDRPEFRNDLAGSWTNKGLALAALGDPASLRDAIAAYDQAIALGAALDLDRPEFRNDLADSWTNKGLALAALGDPASLRDAIAAYDQAIALGALLDLDRPEFLNDLARVLTYRAVLSVRMSNERRQLLSAYDALQRARTLRSRIVAFPLPFFLTAVRQSPFSLFHLGNLLKLLEGYDAATDPLDEGLTMLQQMEQLGLRDQRANREILFREALTAYRLAGQAHFLPELIREHLDPSKPGSAADSSVMHQDADAALSAAIPAMMLQPGGAARIGPLLMIRPWLAGVRTRQLAGSASLALMNADAEQAAGRPQEALRILARQIEFRPTDPGGYWVRARYHLKHGRRALGRQDLMAAASRTLAAAKDPSRHAVAVTQIGAALLRVDLADIADDAVSVARPSRPALQERFDKLKDWLLLDLPNALIAGRAWRDAEEREAWRVALPERLNAHWHEAAELRERLLDAHDRAQADAVRQSVLQQVGEQIELCRSVLALLPQSWRDFADEILAAVQIALAVPGPDETEAKREERIEETIENALKRATSQVDGAELQGEMALLADLLGPVWTQGLLPEEQRYLAVALRCKGDQVMSKFMALELGCAVEFALLERLLLPVRRAHLQQGLELPEAEKSDGHLGQHLRGYLDAQQPLMLGILVGIMGKITSRLARADEAGLFGALNAWWTRQPGHALLRAVDAATWTRRVALLNRLNERRKEVAHPEVAHPVPQSDDPALWTDLVEDANDGFFRYFPAAFLPPR